VGEGVAHGSTTQTTGRESLTGIRARRRSIIRAHPLRLQRTEKLLEAALRRAGRTFPGLAEIEQVVRVRTARGLDVVDTIAPLEDLIEVAKWAERVTVAVRAVRAWAQGVGAVVVASIVNK